MVKQKKVHIIQPQTLQPLINFVVGIGKAGGPEFGGDEDFLTLDTEVFHSPGDAAPDSHFIAVDVGSVDETHANLEGVIDGLLRL